MDGNLYALAYNNNPNKVLESNVSNSLHVIDRRNTVMLPTTFEDNTISTFFNVQSTPTNNWWSGIAVKGWSGEYGVWMLAGPAAGDNAGNRLYYKDGNHSNWATDWKPLAFLEDIKDVGEVYFDNQDIYVDYGYWVVGLCKLTPVTSEAGINGTMYYNRRNGIYANGSVQFSIQKVYNTSDAYAGVLYNGYGVAFNEDAPKLCTFTYGGVKYCGLKWTSAASLNTIKTIIHETWGNNAPFYVLYARSSGSNVINAEIKNSIVELGSDIRLKYVSTSSPIYTSSGRIEINSIANDWAYIRYQTNGVYVDTGLSGTTGGLCGLVGNYEIRPTGSNNEGIFVRYSQSDYGKLGVVNRSGQQCSIGYFNNNTTVGADKPLWTVGAGLRNAYSFDWWFGTNGIRMTLDSDGKLFVQSDGNAPSYSLTIGDNDTGLNWQSDGIIDFMSNSKQVGYYGYSDGRFYNTYFRNPTGNGYAATGMMINGNGSNLYPGLGFHQPGVTAAVLYYTNSGEFKFRNINDTGYTNVYGGNLIADAGYLYSRYNGIEIKIGAENGSYVHFITNPARSLYFANSLFVNGSVLPYVTKAHDLGDASKIWRYIYADRLLGNADTAYYLTAHYKGGQQANPQEYFGQNVGLKVAMTGVNPDSYWGDTLWINGYYGTDVPSLCALHFSRGGAPLMYISTQAYNATSYGTLYHVWTGYNSNHSSADWSCKILNARDQVLAGSYIQALGGINCAGALNSNGCSGFNVYASFHGKTDHGGIEIGASDNVFGMGVHSNDHMYWWWTNSGSIGSSSNKSYIMEYTGSSWIFTGNILATGGVTAKSTSDMRLKIKINNHISYKDRLMNLGMVFDYRFNNIAKSRKGKLTDDLNHIGLSYQTVKQTLPTVTGEDEDKYGYINYISPDLISLSIGAIQEVILEERKIKEDIIILKSKIHYLESENILLKKRLGLIP